MKKWLIGVGSSVILMPILIFSWGNIRGIWAAPSKVESLEARVEKDSAHQEQIAQLVLEQKARMDKDDAVTQVQLQAMKEQLSLISELKKKK